MLGVTEPWWDRLRIVAPEMEKSVRPADSSPLWLLDATEANVAAWIGLCTAVAEFTEAGPAPVWGRLAEVGRQAREALADLPGWAVADPVAAPSAIVALRATNGQDIGKTRAQLLPGIVTTAARIERAPRDMTEPLLRVSPHVDCTPEDLDRLRQALLALA
jgi:hercynylcysteine S-oxide lyase